MSKKRKRRAARTVIFIVLAILLFSLIIFSLYKMDFMDVIEFFPSLFEKNEDPPSSGHENSIKELIDLLEKNESGYESTDIDNASAIKLLSAAPVADSYYHTYSVSYISGDYTTTKNVFVTRAGEAWTIYTREGTASQSTVSFDGKEYTVRDEITGEERRFSENSGMSFEGQNYLTPIAEIKQLLSDYEEKAGTEQSTGIVDAEAELIRTQTENIILVSFRYADSDHVEEYMIHLDYGVIVSASVLRGGKEYYKVTTNVFDPDYKVN